MTSARWPELHSMGPTIVAITSLAFVLTQAAPTVAGTKDAIKAAEEVRKKAKRAFEEFQTVQTIRAEMQAFAQSPATTSPSEITHGAEIAADAIDRMRSALSRSMQAAEMLVRAIEQSSRFERTLERIYPGWQDAVMKVPPALDQVRGEVKPILEQRLENLRGQVAEIFSRSLTEQGLGAWAASLPAEAEPLFDEADVQPIHWDAAQGWVEGAR
jgi:hypothetical protein